MAAVPNVVLRHVAEFAHQLTTLAGGEELAKRDCVYYFTTARDQQVGDLGVTTGIYFCTVFLLCIVADFLVSRPLTWLMLKLLKKSTKDSYKASWFLLHALFNALVVVTAYDETWEVFAFPDANGYAPRGWWGTHPGGLFGAIAIGAFHMHHFAFFEFSFEDIVHHLVNAGAVVVVGALCPWGKFTSLSNFAMCGIPGGANYFLLWLGKLGFMPRLRQKNINRFLNLCLRFPIQLLSHYLIFVSWMAGHMPPLPWFFAVPMALGSTAHSLNAWYYCDQVVGNYWVNLTQDKRTTKQSLPASPDADTSNKPQFEGKKRK